MSRCAVTLSNLSALLEPLTKLCRPSAPPTFFFFLISLIQHYKISPVPLSVFHMFSESTNLHTWAIKAGINQFNTLSCSRTPCWCSGLYVGSHGDSSKDGLKESCSAGMQVQAGSQLFCSTYRFFYSCSFTHIGNAAVNFKRDPH